jgi:hypothetical protein
MNPDIQLRHTMANNQPTDDLVLILKDGGGRSLGWFWSPREALAVRSLISTLKLFAECPPGQTTPAMHLAAQTAVRNVLAEPVYGGKKEGQA